MCSVRSSVSIFTIIWPSDYTFLKLFFPKFFYTLCAYVRELALTLRSLCKYIYEIIGKNYSFLSCFCTSALCKNFNEWQNNGTPNSYRMVPFCVYHCRTRSQHCVSLLYWIIQQSERILFFGISLNFFDYLVMIPYLEKKLL